MNALDAFDAMTVDDRLRVGLWLEINGCAEYSVALWQAWERRVVARLYGEQAAVEYANRAALPGRGRGSGSDSGDELDRRLCAREERRCAERREDFCRAHGISMRPEKWSRK
jgi:hypothetical protein